MLAKPDILLLDEINSGLDVKNGPRVYKDIMDTIPKESTVISIMHNEDKFLHFHTLHAHVANNTVTVKPVTPPAKKVGPGPSAPNVFP